METHNPASDTGTSSQMHGKGMKWNTIWGLSCLPKVKHFIWKACHDVVPTNEAMARRHHSSSMTCNRCGDPSETIEHVIFFCPHSRAIWRASCFNYSPSEIGFGSFANWWLAMVDMMTKGDTSFNLNLLAATVWGIWKVRNKMVFEGEKGDPIKEWLMIDKQYCDFQIGAETIRRGNIQQQTENDVTGWEPPSHAVIKVNCDASYQKSSKLTGIVAVARNSEGVVVGGSNEQIVSPNAFVAECLALRLGSLLAKQHGWTNVIFESDCKNAIEMIKGKRTTTWDAEVIIHDIRNAVCINSNIVFMHISRARNKLADWLAKATLRGTCPTNWVHVMPLALYNFIHAV